MVQSLFWSRVPNLGTRPERLLDPEPPPAVPAPETTSIDYTTMQLCSLTKAMTSILQTDYKGDNKHFPDWKEH